MISTSAAWCRRQKQKQHKHKHKPKHQHHNQSTTNTNNRKKKNATFLFWLQAVHFPVWVKCVSPVRALQDMTGQHFAKRISLFVCAFLSQGAYFFRRTSGVSFDQITSCFRRCFFAAGGCMSGCDFISHFPPLHTVTPTPHTPSPCAPQTKWAASRTSFPSSLRAQTPTMPLMLQQPLLAE